MYKTRAHKQNTTDYLPKYVGNQVINSFVEGDKLLVGSIQCISAILRQEGFNKVKFVNGEEALNLDHYEKRKSTGPISNTVDMVIGCERNILLMVEAKLRVNSINNIDGSNLNKKIRHSRDILIRKEGYSIFPKTIVLLNNQHFERNKRKLLSLLNNSPLICLKTVSTFYEDIFG